MQRDFFLGSQWLYYKVYTGVKTADLILLENLEPVIAELELNKQIKRWFFIRYNDPEAHIRLRFLVDKTNDLLTVINALQPIFSQLMKDNLVWKIQTDTYQREIERYGFKTMDASEFFFWNDSKMILQYLLLQSAFSERETPLFFSFLAIDSFLNSFELSALEKLALMDKLQIAFKKEFQIDKAQKKNLDLNYRTLYPKIKCFLETSNKNDFPEIFSIIMEKSNNIKEVVSNIRNEIEIPLNDFLSSHIHMMLNRQYTSKQRIYELLIYDHMYRYYKTLNYHKNDF
ncbi:thiopeptide-type bacteriocin biosynthesis domain-containing protein [Flavobacterium resistens]|uniref:Thiopeptide-type bacteriocin biosynthesis domain-containing protein n=1 Tax=Flavobacterium resistens TaxID=443612 RepID=A0A521EZI8_9FLAO|nr:thiopeptide-type bacteriocin biosynthesis protein [Flavobacterium resistens]MRX69342.1 hypothetical protein [Flavobacterium resistens]SMO89354.1 thiopeptide-type bacteriocin biosynthesis domain-containing protein [Flavobacterium resistens]